MSAGSTKMPPIYAGVGLISYTKPYQVNLGGGSEQVLNEFLFDARFRGAGLALGAETKAAPYKAFGELEMQLGLGEVQLTDHDTLNDWLPSDWLLGYVQGNLTGGYLLPIVESKPTPMISLAATAGGIYFFFFPTQVEEDEEFTTLPANWDFLWSVRAAFLLPL